MEDYLVFKSNYKVQWHPLFERLQGTPVRLRDRINSVNPYLFAISIAEGYTLLEWVGELITKESWWQYELNKINEVTGEISLTKENYNVKSMVVLLREFENARMVIISQLDQAYGYFEELGLEKAAVSVYELGLTIAENDDLILSGISKLIKDLSRSPMRIFKEE